MRNVEHNIQVACVEWFRYVHRSLSPLLFAVPNGGQRNVIVAAKLKAEGVLAGVSDLLLLVPNKDYHALCIEMKSAKGRQTENQKSWQKEVEKQGYKYAVCRSLDEFMNTINNYLNERKELQRD